jgi:hypothetical protein
MIVNQGEKLNDYALANLKAFEWLQFLRDLRLLFGEEMKWNPNTSAAIMNPRLHRWAKSLDMYLPVISELEAEIQNRSTVQCILSGGNGPHGHLEVTLEQMLCIFTFNVESKQLIFYPLNSKIRGLH